MAGITTRLTFVALLAVCLALGGYVVGSTGDRGGAGTRDASDTGPEQADDQPLPTRTTTSAGHCDGALVHEKVGEVTVPDGAHCVLVAATVGSNVSVSHDGSLRLHASQVGGDVEAEDARSVEVTESTVSGNLQLEGGGSASVADSHVDGDVEWQDQHGQLTARHSTVGGNLEVDENSGGVTIQGNRVDGDLECDGNGPAPTGGGNTVGGHRAEQCHGL